MQIYKNIPLGIFYLKRIINLNVLAKANRFVFKIKTGKPTPADITQYDIKNAVTDTAFIF